MGAKSKNGYSLTVRELCDQLAQAAGHPVSTSIAAYYLNTLEEDGYIQRHGPSWRTITFDMEKIEEEYYGVRR